MGDRAWVQGRVFGATEAQIDTLRDAITEAFGLDTDDTESTGEWRFDVGEWNLGTEAEIATLIESTLPGVAYDVWQDAYSPYLGNLIWFVPDLGRFEHECSDDGSPLFSYAEVLHLAALTPDERDRAIGRPWVAAWEAAQKPATVPA